MPANKYVEPVALKLIVGGVDAGRVFMSRPGAIGRREDACLEKPVHSGFGGACIYTALLKPRIVEMRAAVALP
jgi:hypothetical protein